METFEFSNLGVDHCYDKPTPSDTSVNTQFEAMELEEDQVRNKFYTNNYLHRMKSIILTSTA